ncbi:PspC domain-containing protein [Actinomadura sp. 7K507]|uniref:PspC domain-containing protein n=1 Tax=Actinomadura sp. 7K507 TaxID=2530365 RepID=UPI00104E8B68|nr:PspC domain-containing protein [Actinomadura sp. 7K507]TDC94603.1 PspC domain-containing protein [Actinomadura sp. 7K507]
MSEEQDVRNGADRDRGAGGYERLARDAERRVLAGVCTGLGRYTGIDPVVYRVGFGLLVLAHGQGVILYVAAALLMPASPGQTSLAEQLFKRWFDAAAVMTILGALLCAGVVFSLFGGVPTEAIGVLVLFGLVLLVAHSRGVNLVGAARSVPERLAGHPPEPSATWTQSDTVTVGSVSMYKDTGYKDTGYKDTASTYKDAGPQHTDTRTYEDVPPPPSGGRLPDGMIDLAAYSAAHSAAQDDTQVDDDAPSAKAPAKQDGCKRSPTTAITLLAAMAMGGAMIPVAQAYPAPDSWLIVMAPALAVVGFGLVLGGWLRTPGLATAGTVLSLAMLTTSVAGDLPRNAEYGEVEWRPVDAAQTAQQYRVGVGQGTLDLTSLPVAAGQRVTIDAEVMLGGLEIRVPSNARVMVDAQITLGDLRVGSKTISGPNVTSTEVMEPEGRPDGHPPVIDLRIRGKVGDVDVLRG